MVKIIVLIWLIIITVNKSHNDINKTLISKSNDNINNKININIKSINNDNNNNDDFVSNFIDLYPTESTSANNVITKLLPLNVIFGNP